MVPANVAKTPVALCRMLPLVACHDFGVTEEFLYFDFTDAVDLSAYFQPFDETPSDEANKTSSSIVEGEAHGSGDDGTIRELPVFRRNGGDPMDLNLSHVDLTPYLHSGTSINITRTGSFA